MLHLAQNRSTGPSAGAKPKIGARYRRSVGQPLASKAQPDYALKWQPPDKPQAPGLVCSASVGAGNQTCKKAGFTVHFERGFFCCGGFHRSWHLEKEQPPTAEEGQTSLTFSGRHSPCRAAAAIDFTGTQWTTLLDVTQQIVVCLYLRFQIVTVQLLHKRLVFWQSYGFGQNPASRRAGYQRLIFPLVQQASIMQTSLY